MPGAETVAGFPKTGAGAGAGPGVEPKAFDVCVFPADVPKGTNPKLGVRAAGAEVEPKVTCEDGVEPKVGPGAGMDLKGSTGVEPKELLLAAC